MEKLHSDIESVRILISLLVQKGIKEVVRLRVPAMPLYSFRLPGKKG